MKLSLHVIVTISCAVIVNAFKSSFTFRSSTVSQSSSRLSATTVDVAIADRSTAEILADDISTLEIPPITVTPLPIDKLETDSISINDDLFDKAALAVALGALSAKTVSIYRDESYDFETSAALGKKSPLLFLPGLDGVGNYSSNSVGKLNLVFDVWKMAIKGDDRSTFMELAAFVIKALDTIDEPVVLVGESFGGLLAAYVALRAKKGKVEKLVLINPATSFDRTNWNVVAPLIASSGNAFPLIGMSALLATAVDIAQIQRVGLRIASRLNTTDAAVKEFTALFQAGKYLIDLIPPETLNWRISKWFGAGTSIMNGKYSQIQTPTLILVGKNDRLLPSRDEGKRLQKEMTSSPKVQVKEFDIGHALLEDNFIDFTNIIMKSDVFAVPEEETLDCAMPNEEDMLDVEKQYGTFLKALSPVFLTRGKDGQLKRGLGDVPTGLDGRPVLLVGNHQLYGADLAPIIKQFINEKKTLVRGLAHPAIFAAVAPDGGGSGAQMSQFKKFGAVKVSPSSIFELLKKNETVLLFPGGAREALHGKGEEYKLFWPEKVDFVRMAGLLDAIIVPFSAVGISDSVNIILDQGELQKIPYIRDRAKGSGMVMPSARAGVVEDLLPPLFIPKAPERNYFLFGQPFDTRDLNIYNKKECKAIYAEVKGSVEDGLQTLLRFRESDPYREFIPRAIYEFASGGRQAPTAPLNLK